jgi:hypothetical protein
VGSGEWEDRSREMGMGYYWYRYQYQSNIVSFRINKSSFFKTDNGKNFNVVELAKELCESLNKRFDELINDGFEKTYAVYLSNLYKINSMVKFKKIPVV